MSKQYQHKQDGKRGKIAQYADHFNCKMSGINSSIDPAHFDIRTAMQIALFSSKELSNELFI